MKTRNISSVGSADDERGHFCGCHQVLDLSHDLRQIKALTGDHGEHFNRIVTEVELLGQDCELCGKLEDELQKLKNHSQDALGRINRLQTWLDSGSRGCDQMCSQLEDEVRLLRVEIKSCTDRCHSSPDMHGGQAPDVVFG